MKLRAQYPPHIRTRETNQSVMSDALIALLPLYAMATYYYGVRAIFLGFVGVATAILTNLLCVMMARRVPNIRDLSSLVTGLLIPLLMPASIRWEIVAAATIFAIAVAKYPFGGVGQNIFNPAAVGAAFAMICWDKQMFAYPVPVMRLPLLAQEVRMATSPAKALMLGGVPTTELLDMLLGNSAGPMGATHTLVLLTCLLFLTVRKTASLPMSLSFFAGAAVLAAMFPRAMMSPLDSVLYELMSGMMIIGGVFLLNDPVTSPKRRGPKLAYGFLTGALCIAFRHLGRFEESLLFALLVMNAAVWLFDLWGEMIAHKLRRKHIEARQNQEISQDSADDLRDL